MRTLSVIALLLALASPAKADIALSVGVGKGITGAPGTPFERVVALGYEHRFPIGVFVRPEAGYFMDISGRGLSSIWVAPLVGVRAKSSVGPILQLAVGPGYLHNPDATLGGHFQFSLEGCVGIEDSHLAIEICEKHLSSAGIHQPNAGRDFIVAQVRALDL